MTFQQAIELATEKLSLITESAKLDAQLLLYHTCEIELTKLLAYPEQELNPQHLELFLSALERRAQGEPLAYITGLKEFWSLDFIVNKDVLIPRPETELLVELVLQAIAKIKSPRVLELGTGSGAIAIAIANERKDCDVVATDISQSALDVASENAKRNYVNIEFVQTNWFENITGKKFDVIVTNPPYIANDDPNLDKFVSKHEPIAALVSGHDGLHALSRIIADARKYLEKSGSLIVEHGFQQKNEVKNLFEQNIFSHIQCHRDLANLDRVISGIKI